MSVCGHEGAPTRIEYGVLVQTTGYPAPRASTVQRKQPQKKLSPAQDTAPPDAASVGRGCRAVMESARAAADECGVSAHAERRYRAVWISAIPSIPVRPMQSTHPTIHPQRERLYPSALFSSNSGEEQPKQALTGQDVSLEHPSEEVHQREVYAISIRSGWNVESSVALTCHASNATTKQGSREQTGEYGVGARL
ncbi:hypothetical protein B0H14DRAFT_2655705 [Mycena olivaceomarginata]|nr:hypothetical protein B0H14DRAFT_2655705 [Mycena olivaceomarginata]